VTNSFKQIVSEHMGPPVNIEAIVRSLGLELDKKATLDDEISGQLERLEGRKFKISANKDHHYFRQRFTIAHELGHFMLHADLIGEGVDDNKAYRSGPDGRFYNQAIGDREEAEANRFAARILIPKPKVMEVAAINTDVATLAKQFQVSPAAMEIRLKSLGFQTENGKISQTPI